MGRNSGGVRGGAKTNKKGSTKAGATEKGYTSKMVKNIVGIEQNYRRNVDETLHVFDSDGNIITSVGGKRAQVNIAGVHISPNSILTHNHPRSLGTTGISRIGHSFSKADIAVAISRNAKEVRAVTPTYTFSLKRPSGGWGVNVRDFLDSYKGFKAAATRWENAYFKKAGYTKETWSRVDVTHFHDIMKKIAKKYGWDYTKKKG